SVSGSPFPAGPSPQSVTIEHTGHFLYVPNGNGASISAYAIDQLTGALVSVAGSPFATGSVPFAAVVRKSFLSVANSFSRTVSQYAINPTTGTLTSIANPFPTGSAGPMALTVSPNEPLLYVANHDADVVLVLGIRTDGTIFNESSIRTRGSPL